ncbi:MAG: hypothetical protein ABH864_06090 [archaeon]
MKGLVILAIVLFSVGLVSGMPGACDSKCLEGKNSGLKVLWEMKADLGDCKPDFLECVRNGGKLVACREEYSNCKWGGIDNIRNKNIEINNNYNTCVNECNAEVVIEEVSVERAGSFCLALNGAQRDLVAYFGYEGFRGVLEVNGCGVSGVVTL